MVLKDMPQQFLEDVIKMERDRIRRRFAISLHRESIVIPGVPRDTSSDQGEVVSYEVVEVLHIDEKRFASWCRSRMAQA